MATQYGTQMGRLRNTLPVDLPMAGDIHGRVRLFNEKVVLAAQPTSDIVEVARLPKGARVLYGILNSSVSLGSATLAVGIAGGLARCRSEPGQRLGVLLVNVDRFEAVNVSQGHAVGDSLLRSMADRLTGLVRSGDAVTFGAARLGGDEFVVVLDRLREPDHVAVVAQRVVDALARPYAVGGQPLHVGASVGAVLCDGGEGSAADVLDHAALAMREAKRGGGGRWVMFEPDMKHRAARRGTLERELREAITQRQLFVVYQPILALDGGRCHAVEALVRWRHPERGIVPPLDFIPVAEECGLIGALGLFVLGEACAQLARWQSTLGAAAPNLDLYSARVGAVKMCQECSSDMTCAPGNYCAKDFGPLPPDGLCAPCNLPDHCGTSCMRCPTDRRICSAGACVECAVDTDCPSGKVCDPGTKSCRWKTCSETGDCPPEVRYAGGCSTSPTVSATGSSGPQAATSLTTKAGVAAALGALLVLLRRRRRRSAPRAGGLGLLLAGLLVPGSAQAQLSANAMTFHPAFGPENVITVEGTRTPKSPRPVLNLLFEYAHRPIYVYHAQSREILANTVSSLSTLHLMAGMGIVRWLSLGIDLPVVAYQGFDRRTPLTDVPQEPDPGGLGDLRVIAKARLINNERGGFGLAFVPQVTFPTGNGQQLRGDDAYGIEPRFGQRLEAGCDGFENGAHGSVAADAAGASARPSAMPRPRPCCRQPPGCSTGGAFTAPRWTTSRAAWACPSPRCTTTWPARNRSSSPVSSAAWHSCARASPR